MVIRSPLRLRHWLYSGVVPARHAWRFPAAAASLSETEPFRSGRLVTPYSDLQLQTNIIMLTLTITSQFHLIATSFQKKDSH